MTPTIIENPVIKNNLAKEISPFVSSVSDTYRVTYCLFSQFTAHQLLNIYTSWNWRIADKADAIDKDILSLISSMVKCTFSIVSILEKWDFKDGFTLQDNIEALYDTELKGVQLIDKFVIEYLDQDARFDDYMRCAALTRQMMFNAYLIREKGGIPNYEI